MDQPSFTPDDEQSPMTLRELLRSIGRDYMLARRYGLHPASHSPAAALRQRMTLAYTTLSQAETAAGASMSELGLAMSDKLAVIDSTSTPTHKVIQ